MNILNGFLIVFLSGLVACELRSEKQQINDNKDNSFSCDSISSRGVYFWFSKNEKIDSIECFRQENHLVSSRLEEEEEYKGVIIYDTFVFENEYKLILYFNGFSKTHSIKNILWKPKRVYNGVTCSLKSCVFNDSLIKADAGKFDLR